MDKQIDTLLEKHVVEESEKERSQKKCENEYKNTHTWYHTHSLYECVIMTKWSCHGSSYGKNSFLKSLIWSILVRSRKYGKFRSSSKDFRRRCKTFKDMKEKYGYLDPFKIVRNDCNEVPEKPFRNDLFWIV